MNHADSIPPRPAALERITWRLERGIAVPSGASITARFAGGTLTGSVGGVPYRATYLMDASGGGLRIATSTSALGPAPARDYHRLLAAVHGARTGPVGTLILLDGQGQGVLWFRQVDTVGSGLAGRWAVEAVRRGQGLAAPATGGDPHLWFDPAGQVIGSVGVNRVRGPARSDGDAVHLGPLAVTRMAGEPDAMDEEADLLAALEQVARFRGSGDRLTLLDADGETLVELRRTADPPPPTAPPPAEGAD